jgi:hypothetical protein
MVALGDVLQQEPGRMDVLGVTVIVRIVTLALLLVVVARKAPHRAGLTLLVGLCLLAVAVNNGYEHDQFLNVLGRGDQERGDLDYEFGIVLKQGLELLGWSFVTIGIWETALATRMPSVTLQGSSNARASAGPTRGVLGTAML